MGCDSYEYRGKVIRFSEGNEDFGCLCTFPHNDAEKLSDSRIQSLALLGAAIALIKRDEFYDKGYIYLPQDLPQWILEGIANAMAEQWG